MRDCIALPIAEDSQVGDARRIAVNLAIELGFNETERGNIAIVVTEAAKNVLKHATRGEVLLQPIALPEGTGIEIIAIDAGSGMSNLARCFQDGFSTMGTPGIGLGAIQRLSHFFDIYSSPQIGTLLVSRFWLKHQPQNNLTGEVRSLRWLDVGAIGLPKPEQQVSGDAWAIEMQRDRALILIADGLGSGELAAEASREAVRLFRANANLSPQQILEQTHPALRATRGAAVAIASIVPAQNTLHYAGVGNTCATILTDGMSRSLVSYNGTIGAQVRKFAQFSYEWSERSLLVMNTDGLSTHWNLDRYPGLLARHPSSIAAMLYRDFKRDRDDVTVLVAKMGSDR
jgi:anti-sigma regulatory factor (Ser/Thr protein kinase)